MAPARKKQKVADGDVVAAVPNGLVPDHETDASANREDKPEQRKSLFVRSLPPTTTSQSLTDLFSDSYPIRHATAVTDPATKQCRGYGFVTFAEAEDAERAKKEFDGHVFGGRKLRVEIAEPRHRDGENGASPTDGSKGRNGRRELNPDGAPKLIVRNLPWTIKTSDQLAKLFMSYGKIKQAYLPKTKTGTLAGFGFVLLRGRKNATKALEGVNGKEVDGRTIAVDWAVKKDVYEGLVNAEATTLVPGAENQIDQLVDDGHDTQNGFDSALPNDTDTSENEDVEGSADDQDEELHSEADGEVEPQPNRIEDRSGTLFVRNLPFTCTDEDLDDHFSQFGSVRYARVVMDQATERSKGTGFVCFYSKSDADACLRSVPNRASSSGLEKPKDGKPVQASNSLLQNEDADPSGRYTLDGRVLHVSRAVEKAEASRLTEEGAAHRHKRNEDKRRLYLLAEGTIPTNSKLWEKLSPSERTMRDASAKQRKALIQSNPSLHLSLTRLSIRNIPRSIGSKELKSLAREAVVGFATDVKEEKRQKLSKEELSRGGEEMQEAEKGRKKSGKGIVKQAKVVFEGASGSKIEEQSGAGRSRGYGFIEYYTHRNALMGLRWLNGHAVGYQVKEGKKTAGANREEKQDRKKRLIVEFAIENAQSTLR